MPRKRTDGVPKKQTTAGGLKPVKPTSKERDSPVLDTSVPFPIVGIGASAGGLEAFEQFFTHTPPDTGMAFVLIQHLDPKHKSILTELIQRFTRMKVHEVEDGMVVEPNTIYVIPPTITWPFCTVTSIFWKCLRPRLCGPDFV
jgi:two-component system, chemotaxis family, CheB/CheR fusion protein